MSTFKVVELSKTNWVLGVREIVEINAFDVPKEAQAYTQEHTAGGDEKTSEYRKAYDAIITAAFNNKGSHPPCPLRVVEFSGHTNGVGKVIRVTETSGRERLWIIPNGSGYILGDDGRTIDRM